MAELLTNDGVKLHYDTAGNGPPSWRTGATCLHFMFIENPDRFNRLVGDFLSAGSS
ncbi:hypothetical protein [Candidatus Poriferisodalis multihospitum]|uniref:hypothetical protein n=1 Tax=Candidatus Poriferisodalis multihospitum TaxID=2983191 RepID=UPI002B262AFD|nr:hypothetical protein [Candidatus Poriferisodalis multihospitum]